MIESKMFPVIGYDRKIKFIDLEGKVCLIKEVADSKFVIDELHRYSDPGLKNVVWSKYFLTDKEFYYSDGAQKKKFDFVPDFIGRSCGCLVALKGTEILLFDPEKNVSFESEAAFETTEKIVQFYADFQHFIYFAVTESGKLLCTDERISFPGRKVKKILWEYFNRIAFLFEDQIDKPNVAVYNIISDTKWFSVPGLEDMWFTPGRAFALKNKKVWVLNRTTFELYAPRKKNLDALYLFGPGRVPDMTWRPENVKHARTKEKQVLLLILLINKHKIDPKIPKFVIYEIFKFAF